MRHFNRLAALGALWAVVAASGLTGCSWQNKKEAQETGRTTSQVATDNAVSEQVAEALKTSPLYKYPSVHVAALNGVVQLSGFVQTEAQKEEAERIARQTAGVHQVRDDLVVQPLTPTGRTGQENQGTAPPPSPAPQPGPEPQPK